MSPLPAPIAYSGQQPAKLQRSPSLPLSTPPPTMTRYTLAVGRASSGTSADRLCMTGGKPG